MKILRTFKYRIYPNREQERLLLESLRACRFVYNYALKIRRKEWRQSRRSLSAQYDLGKVFAKWRNECPANDGLMIVPAHTVNRVLLRLDRAFEAFFKKQRGYPRFKSDENFNSIPYEFGNGSHIKNNELRLFGVGDIKVKWHRQLTGKVKEVVAKRIGKKWYACFFVEIQIQVEPSKNPKVGIDVGLMHALALSDGVMIDSPQWFRHEQAKLRRAQRHLSRCKKGSNRRKEAKRRVAAIHEKIKNQRRDWWHKITRGLVDTYGFIALEDLPLAFMNQNRHLAKISTDIGLGALKPLLGYKAIEAGVQLAFVDPKNTSQICSNCGAIVEKELSERIHDCSNCGLMIDRDTNAAINILARAAPADANVNHWIVRCPQLITIDEGHFGENLALSVRMPIALADSVLQM